MTPMKEGVEYPSETIELDKEKCGWKKTGCGNLHVTTVFRDETKEKFHMVEAHLGKEGTCLRHWMNMIGNFTALAFKKGATMKEVVDCLTGECGNAFIDVKSCSHAMGELLREHYIKEET